MPIIYPTSRCKSYNLIPVPRRSETSEDCYVRVGCNSCDICIEEKIARKAEKWKHRIHAMIEHYQENNDRVLFHTFTVHDEMMPDYFQLKGWLSQTFNALRVRINRKEGKDKFKYWCVLEKGSTTGRLHAHAFFFVDKSVAWEPHMRWLNAYWEERYKAYISHTRVVSSASMAASYATKYAVKQVGYFNDRMLTSKFGWANFMEAKKRKWLGLEDVEGCQNWVVLDLPQVDEEVERLGSAPDVGEINRVLKKFIRALDNPVGRVRIDRPVLHPFSGCFETWSGDIFNVATKEEKEWQENSMKSNRAHRVTWILKDSLVFLPDNARFGVRTRSHLEKLLRVLGRRFDLPHIQLIR